MKHFLPSSLMLTPFMARVHRRDGDAPDSTSSKKLSASQQDTEETPSMTQAEFERKSQYETSDKTS